jgi:hypothetical protein
MLSSYSEELKIHLSKTENQNKFLFFSEENMGGKRKGKNETD